MTASEKPSTMGTVKALARSLRPHQWPKNVFLFAALVFAHRLRDPFAVLEAAKGFAAFCMLASAVYLINDIMDREQDRLHPTKKNRPIASGLVPLWVAAVMGLLLLLGGFAISLSIGTTFVLVAATYSALSYAYCFGVKRFVILDVMVLASGYPLRAVAGAAAIDVEISHWLLLCTSLLALFLGFCKRRQELVSLRGDAESHRAVLSNYSVAFIDQMIAVVTASTVVCYAFYAFSDEVALKLGTQRLGLTVPFVLYGIFRYFYLVHMVGGGGSPSREVVRDKPFLVNGLLWGTMVILILYVWP